MSVATKSTGQLVDETITCAFRLVASSAESLDARFSDLIASLDSRLGPDVARLISELVIVLYACWVSQEIVMSETDDTLTARAARQAQRLNAHRSRLVRKIDELLGESGITVMTKTYDVDSRR